MLANPHRTLYLVAYDIADHRRLARVHRYLLGWHVGGQNSFYECWLTPAELSQIVDTLGQLIEPADDRVHIFQLDARMAPKCYGVASTSRQQTVVIL